MASDQEVSRVESGVEAILSPLSSDERRRHGEIAGRLIERFRWEAPVGEVPSDWQKSVVARCAAVLAVGFDEGDDLFAGVRSVIIHPRPVRLPEWTARRSGGVARSGTRVLAGQSGHGRGPVVLAWSQVVVDLGRPSLGRNVILHEFAHKFDQLDGAADGMPPLADRVVRAEFDRVMKRSLNRVRLRRQQLLRPYAGTDPAEHFAVATENFFTRPDEVRRRAGALFEVMSMIYRHEPAWVSSTPNS